jgi:hypothetical protein
MSENKSRFVLLCQQALACAVVVAVAAPATGVATLDIVPAPPRTPGTGGGALVAADPVDPTVTEVPLTGPVTGPVPDRSGLRLLSAGGGGAEAPLTGNAEPLPTDGDGAGTRSEPQPVEGYATVGVTWSQEQRFEDDEIRVAARTMSDGDWSAWQELHYDAAHGPDPESPEAAHQRFGTDPLVVGDVEDVQVEAVTSEGGLPAEMSLVVVDPGKQEVEQEQPAIDTARLSAGVELMAAAGRVTPKPRIYSRKQWGANERLRDKGSLRYFEVHAGFVHHTVNANRYSRAQVPSIIRGIYAYHTQSRGWSDIGYNFLVDRFGRIWEGRYGGVGRPVVGAHTLGYNDDAFAMSAIGNFDTARPGSKLLDAYGRLFAWKLGLHGVDPADRSQRVGNRRIPAVNGHRDVGQTACPGRHLYARIGAIRKRAGSYQRSFRGRNKDTDISGSPWPDLVVRNKRTKRAYVVRTAGQVGFGRGRTARTGWDSKDLVAAVRDLDGDHRPDLLARKRGSRLTGLHRGNGRGGFGKAERITKRFRSLDRLVGVGDLNDDGKNDVVGRHASDGRLLFYRGKGNGGFRPKKLLARNWSGYSRITGIGDFDGDGHPDLAARAGKTLYLFPGTGRAALGKRRALPYGWERFDLIRGIGDVTNDGRPDIIARLRKSQVTYVYPGNGRGGFGQRFGGFTRFANVDFLAAAGRVDRSKGNDLVGRSRSGRLVVFSNSGGERIGKVVPTGRTFKSTNLVLNVGDWNGDGRNDVMTRRRDGAMVLRLGAAGGRLARGVVAGRFWDHVRLVAAVGDVTGDGRPDLMGQPSRRGMRIYPGNGRTGFRRSYPAHSAISANRHVGAGRWGGDGAPDSIVRRSNGNLALFPGNGPGGLTGARKVGTGAGRYDWLIGAGDVDGNGTTDLIARAKADGRLWLLPGRGAGFGPRRFIAGGFGKYDLAG